MNIIEAVNKVLEANVANDFLNEFARNKFRELHPREATQSFKWSSYDGFKIIDKKTIEIRYSEGIAGSEIEYHDKYIIDISDEIRDLKIDEIKKLD